MESGILIVGCLICALSLEFPRVYHGQEKTKKKKNQTAFHPKPPCHTHPALPNKPREALGPYRSISRFLTRGIFTHLAKAQKIKEMTERHIRNE